MIDQTLSNDLPGESGAGAEDAGTRAPHWRDLYPFDSHYVKLPAAMTVAAGVTQHYIDENPEAERSFLFVHGNPTWSFYWRHLVLGLRDSFRCVAVDHVGCGLSDKPQSYSYTLDQHIANLGNLIQTLDLRRVTLVAHDWGGAIGLGALQEHQHRFEGIVLMNTGAFPPPYIPWRIRACRIPWLGTVAIRGFNGFAGAAVKMATSRPGGLAPEVKAGLLAPYHDWETRIATDEFVKDIPVSSSQPTFQRLAAIEANCKDLADLPVQLIWGMQDWCFRPDCLHRFQKMFPQARTREIPLANHYVVEDAPELVLQTIQEFAKATGG